MRLKVDVKSVFHYKKVKDAGDGVLFRALTGLAAFIYKAARREIRPGKKPSKPGKPPKGRTGLLKEGILFDVADDMTAVIGPRKLNRVYFDKNHQPVRGTVPSVLEDGGEIYVLEILKHGYWQRADLRQHKSSYQKYPQRYRKVKIDERPYMKTAFKKGIKDFAAKKKKYFGELQDAGILQKSTTLL